MGKAAAEPVLSHFLTEKSHSIPIPAFPVDPFFMPGRPPAKPLAFTPFFLYFKPWVKPFHVPGRFTPKNSQSRKTKGFSP